MVLLVVLIVSIVGGMKHNDDNMKSSVIEILLFANSANVHGYIFND